MDLETKQLEKISFYDYEFEAVHQVAYQRGKEDNQKYFHCSKLHPLSKIRVLEFLQMLSKCVII